MNNIPSATLKSAGFATLLFWILLASEEGLLTDAIPFVFISIIPIFIICILGITVTIMPFCWIEGNKLNSNQIFNKYFPYYAIVSFGICSSFIVSTNFESFVVCLFTTAYFTSISSWIWVFKPQKIFKT